MKKLLFS